jgi:uncharacterized protein YcaQ
VLRVQSAYAESGVDKAEVATALSAELRELAGWLGLNDVASTGRGDLELVV